MSPTVAGRRPTRPRPPAAAASTRSSSSMPRRCVRPSRRRRCWYPVGERACLRPPCGWHDLCAMADQAALPAGLRRIARPPARRCRPSTGRNDQVIAAWPGSRTPDRTAPRPAARAGPPRLPPDPSDATSRPRGRGDLAEVGRWLGISPVLARRARLRRPSALRQRRRALSDQSVAEIRPPSTGHPGESELAWPSICARTPSRASRNSTGELSARAPPRILPDSISESAAMRR